MRALSLRGNIFASFLPARDLASSAAISRRCLPLRPSRLALPNQLQPMTDAR